MSWVISNQFNAHIWDCGPFLPDVPASLKPPLQDVFPPDAGVVYFLVAPAPTNGVANVPFSGPYSYRYLTNGNIYTQSDNVTAPGHHLYVIFQNTTFSDKNTYTPSVTALSMVSPQYVSGGAAPSYPPPPPPPTNDTLATAQVINTASGFGVVRGTTKGATGTDFDESGEHSAWYIITGLPPGGLFIKLRSDSPDGDIYMDVFDDTNRFDILDYDTYVTGLNAYQSWPEDISNGEIKSGSAVLRVYSYDDYDGDFTFGWGAAALDTNPSHFGPETSGDWRLASSSSPYYPPGSVGQNHDRVGLDLFDGYALTQFSVHYGYVEPTPFFSDPIPSDSAQETCAWNNARKGNINALSSKECSGFLGLNSGTHDNAGLGNRSGTGYFSDHSSGGFFTSGYKSRYETFQDSKIFALEGPQYAGPYPDFSGWGLVYEGGSVESPPNKLRNLHSEWACSDPWVNSSGLKDTRAWTVSVRALLASDQIPDADAYLQGPGYANKWSSGVGANWQDPERTDTPELGTLGITHDATYSLDISDVDTHLQTKEDATVASILPFYLNSSLLNDGTPPLLEDDVFTVREYTLSLVTVEYQVPSYRAYLGFELDELVMPPMRQRHRDDGLTTDARQEKGHGSSLQTSLRRGGRTYY